ncbi:hypothetical protein LV89_04975 [Arcicella aurantiaca]|uniref:Uncharacterized protein n=1 Tax=Arcicella aurantiaca TaxID=591202 RepID=A0A316DCQ6_9BACT|nr:hypothetical protein [Arcicella aurantiaca]PWK15735.1 hypothetical protein LV89_04975 [Arcicella aurantiaca]
MEKLKIKLLDFESQTLYNFIIEAYRFADLNGKIKIDNFIRYTNSRVTEIIQKGYAITEISLKINSVRYTYEDGDAIENILFKIEAENISDESGLRFDDIVIIYDGDRQYLRDINVFKKKYRSVFEPNYEQHEAYRIAYEKELSKYHGDSKWMERDRQEKKKKQDSKNKIDFYYLLEKFIPYFLWIAVFIVIIDALKKCH